MIKLTAVIITYNEEKNIRKCLESVFDVADEIVVVDSFSSDATETICKKYGVRFVKHPFEGHIEQKNFAVSQSSNDHILSLDADECLSEKLKESILEVKKNWEYDGYSFKRLTCFCGKWIKHTSWYPSKKLRLWDRRKGRWGGRNPHDRFILDKGASHKVLRGDLLHYSYNSINEHIKQINYFSTIIAREYFKENIRITRPGILIHAFWRFLRDYFVKLGFLDGLYGLLISVNSSFETYLKYAKLRIMNMERSESEKNKIAFVNSMKAWGGGEKWHFDISGKLNKKGYEILLISSPGSDLTRKAIDNHLPVRKIKISNLSFLNPVKIFMAYRILKSEMVGILFINLSADLKLFGFAAKLAGVKKIIYRRGSALPIRNTILNRILLGKVVTNMIANSEETKRKILQNNPHFIMDEKIMIIYNGIDLQALDKKEWDVIYKRKNNEILIGNAGRLSEEKGQTQLIELARNLKSKDYKFKILIAGKGKLETSLRNMVKQNGLEEEMILVGFVENMKSFNSTIDIFVLTSLYEGFGNVITEAMALCKPVVAFDTGSSGEIIENGISGFLVQKGNVGQLTDKVEMLIKDENLRKDIGNQGRKRVEELFTIEIALSKVEELIRKSC